MKNIWDERFMAMAEMVGSWTNCIRADRKVGAVIVKDNSILGIGFNGAPAGLKSCAERGECIRQKMKIQSGTHQEICYAVCAEQNAISQAIRNNRDLSGATIYISHTPCAICARWIINVGIKRVVYKAEYTDKFSFELLKEAGVTLQKI